MGIDELITIYVQEEGRMNCNRVELAISSYTSKQEMK